MSTIIMAMATVAGTVAIIRDPPLQPLARILVESLPSNSSRSRSRTHRASDHGPLPELSKRVMVVVPRNRPLPISINLTERVHQQLHNRCRPCETTPQAAGPTLETVEVPLLRAHMVLRIVAVAEAASGALPWMVAVDLPRRVSRGLGVAGAAGVTSAAADLATHTTQAVTIATDITLEITIATTGATIRAGQAVVAAMEACRAARVEAETGTRAADTEAVGHAQVAEVWAIGVPDATKATNGRTTSLHTVIHITRAEEVAITAAIRDTVATEVVVVAGADSPLRTSAAASEHPSSKQKGKTTKANYLIQTINF